MLKVKSHFKVTTEEQLFFSRFGVFHYFIPFWILFSEFLVVVERACLLLCSHWCLQHHWDKMVSVAQRGYCSTSQGEKNLLVTPTCLLYFPNLFFLILCCSWTLDKIQFWLFWFLPLWTSRILTLKKHFHDCWLFIRYSIVDTLMCFKQTFTV